MLDKIGYKTKKIPVIPMSGFRGENLTKKSDKMPWYKGFSVTIKKKKVKGFTLIDALNDVVKPPKRDTKSPVRMPVSGVYKIKGVGDVITGRIEQGVLNPGQSVIFSPSGASGKVFTIEMHHKSVEKALTGDNVGLNLRGLNKDLMPRAGDVMCIDDGNAPTAVASFVSQVYVQDHPGKLRCGEGDSSGFTPSIHVRTAKAPCKMSKIRWKQGLKSTGGAKIEEGVKYLEAGDTAEVEWVPQKPICVTPYKSCKGLARLAVMDSNNLVMLGKITEVTYKS
eukprot:TRINITY_DN842_c0_g1_i5.p1 TRINITY_DN842_c0_g1~~TRINITY_DN842_c0_g1_i5.p1  ORF type:complete len:280 (-),score=69.02 TRINITY_DN842_c0_g1_i5:51-890(-)